MYLCMAAIKTLQLKSFAVEVCFKILNEDCTAFGTERYTNFKLTSNLMQDIHNGSVWNIVGLNAV